MNQDFFTREELGLECAETEWPAILQKLATLARVDVFMAFPDAFDHRDIGRDAGMPDYDKATREEVLAYLQQKPAASVTLSVQSGGVGENGLSVVAVARLIGLPDTSSKETVRATLREKIAFLFPQISGERELSARLHLIGLSAAVQSRAHSLRHPWAGLDPMQAYRGMMASALTPQPRAFGAVLEVVNRLPEQRVLSVVAGLVARRRGGSSLVALRASAGARAGAPLPTRMRVMDWGTNHTLRGRFVVNEITLSGFAEHQRRHGLERVALDFEHNTVPGTPEYERTQEPRPVAAYWTPQIIRGEGIVLTAPTWTPSGEARALDFEDLSATLITDGQQVLGLHSVALTRAGASDFHFLHVPGFDGVALSATRPRRFH